MALTELPALFLMLMATTALAFAERRVGVDLPMLGNAVLAYLVAGLCIGLAVMARQTYLPAIALPLVTAFYSGRPLWLPAMAVALVVAIVAPVFIAWGGLVPPGQEVTGGGIVLTHGALSFGYVSIMAWFIAPRFLTPALHPAVFTTIAAGAVIFAASTELSFLPLRSVLLNFFSDRLVDYIALVGGAILNLLGSIFLYSSIALMRKRWQEAFFSTNILFAVIMTGTYFGVVHLFSSRYVMMSLPFLLLALQPWLKLGRWAFGRFALGCGLGMLALTSYFYG